MNDKSAKILIVEDEKHINRLIELVLLSDGYYRIQKAFDGNEALKLIKISKPDLILLDVMLPGIDGMSLCQMLKKDEYLKSIPVIMLTAKKMENDILEGFEKGAIDYITKPFSNKILLARINVHLQNTSKGNNIFVLDYDNCAVRIKNNEIKLTNFEFKLMKLFVGNIGKTYSRTQLLQYLRGYDGCDISERAMDVHIVNLRKKLGANYIQTIRGIGYKLKETPYE